MSDRQYRVFRKVEETPTALSIFLSAVGSAPLDSFRAGQYLTFDIPGVGERKYVLSAFSRQPKLYRITVSHRGEDLNQDRNGASFWRHDVAVGDILGASGPVGSFHLAPELDRPSVLLSRGIGEVAVAAIAEELALKAPRHRISFLHSSFDSSTFALKGKLTSLRADLPNARWKILFSSPCEFDRLGRDYDQQGELDLETSADLFPDEEFDVYICGPRDFVAATEKSMAALTTRRFRLSKQDMGADMAPPVAISRTNRLPPLVPRSVRFVRTGKQATWTPEQGTLLEFAEHLGVSAPFSCRTGMCGKCAQKILAGEVTKVRDTSARIGDDRQLLCSTIPLSDLVIDL
jgi:ferredoxin-NADP reductase